jgi:RND family efflux transporter MFP subunit
MLLICVSCIKNNTDNSSASRANTSDSILTITPNVAIQKVRNEEFALEIVSNGHVKAKSIADIYFRSADIVSNVYVHNGQYVKRGQPLASLDLYKLNAEKNKLAATLEQARLDMQDVLIGQGYAPDDFSSIPSDVLKLARIRSGLAQAETSYNLALKDIEQATLKAPFDGLVANLSIKPHTMASTTEPACQIINTSNLEVEFPILESELAYVSIGDKVDVSTFSTDNISTTGTITEINPQIAQNGQITIKATIKAAKSLIDGMNVRTIIKRTIKDCLVVPKSAVVLRSNRQVIFTYENGKAMWNYVKTGLENLTQYTITEGLQAGQEIIISGNENLAHQAPVNLIK